MKVHISTIPHTAQRYPTAGDWGIDYIHSCNGCATRLVSKTREEEVCPKCSQPMDYEERIWINVSQMEDWRMPMLVAVHELVEVLMCKQAGITADLVDDFDMAFESERAMRLEKATPEQKLLIDMEEPGDHKDAPYVRQHGFASGVERILAAEMGVNWEQYCQVLEKLA